jgi:hypothetical protein
MAAVPSNSSFHTSFQFNPSVEKTQNVKVTKATRKTVKNPFMMLFV